MYFPSHLKYAEVHTEPNLARGNKSYIFRDTTAEWKLALTLATIVAVHMYVQSTCSSRLDTHSEPHLQSILNIHDIHTYHDQQSLTRLVDDFPGSDLSGFLRCPVSTAASKDLEPETRRQSEHSHHVHPEPWCCAYVPIHCHSVCSNGVQRLYSLWLSFASPLRPGTNWTSKSTSATYIALHASDISLIFPAV